MKSKLFLVALSGLALAACTNDEVIEMKQDAIAFSVTAGNTTRAVVTTTNTIDNFKVRAMTAGGTCYMNNVVVTKSSDGVWGYEGTQFWPTENLTFYSVSPSTIAFGGTEGNGKPKVAFSVAEKATDQIDLLYATNADVSKPAEDATDKSVKVNFRHALAQLVFKAKNTNPKLNVMIKGVRVARVEKSGTMYWPSTTTSVIVPTEGILSTSLATWTLDQTLGTFTADVEMQKISSEASFLTKVEKGDNGNITSYPGSLLLLPQTIIPWAPSEEGTAYEKKSGAYFLINCKIQDATSGEWLWGFSGNSGGHAEIAVPITTNMWEGGRRYIYTFIFGEGAGYVPPTPDPDDPSDPTPDPEEDKDPENPDIDPTPGEEGDEVLVPISFTVTVDDFMQGGNFETDMQNGTSSVPTE